ncbi:MAG: PBECR2 nuclease fold domain-containing protein [Halanaerobium sp.]
MIRKYCSTKDYVGELKEEIIELFNLPFKNTDIYIGGTNKKHIRKKHKKEFDKYLDKLPEIINNPTYVGVYPSQGGIEFIKKYEDNVMVAVRASKKDVLYVRSVYCITEDKVERYLENESIKKIKL